MITLSSSQAICHVSTVQTIANTYTDLAHAFPTHQPMRGGRTLRHELKGYYFLLLTDYAVVGTGHERKPSSFASTAQLQIETN